MGAPYILNLEIYMIKKVKEHFINNLKNSDQEMIRILEKHLPQVEKWALKLLEMYPEANKDIVLMGVWLHDIGHVIGNSEIDHAINSETEAKRLLTEHNLPKDIIDSVAHCVRSHRCKDVQPNTMEAKIIAAADSASHLTGNIYADMASRGEIERALGKLERDIRDTKIFSELYEQLYPVYLAWKQLLTVWPK